MTNTKVSHSNLYVTNIPPEVDNDSLNQVFSSYGSVVSCRLVKNQKNSSLNSYGFVKMNSVEEAQQAIDKLNGATLNQSVLEVKYADLDSGEKAKQQQSGIENDNLYVRNVPHIYTEDDISGLFTEYGAVLTVKLLPSGDPQKGNGAMVKMGSVDEAQKAINGLNLKVPAQSTQQLLVRYADTAQEKARKTQSMQKKQGVPQNNVYGANPYQGQQVAYVNGQPIPILVDPLTGQATLGNSSTVMQPAGQQICSVYVCNLPEDSDKLTIYENFNQFGAIKNVRVLMDEQNKCKGVGFVNYMDLNAANKAIQTMNGARIGDREIWCSLQQKKQK